MGHQRFLIVSFPGQGHINPTLQFAKRLHRAGVEITFATADAAYRRMNKDAVPAGITFATYSDGYQDVFKASNLDFDDYVTSLRTHGSQSLGDIIDAEKAAGRPFTCVVYATLLPWAASVARERHVPSVLLWIQPATVFLIYYYYFDGSGPHSGVIRNCMDDPSRSIQLPGLPPLTGRDLPSLILPALPYGSMKTAMEEHVKILKEEDGPRVLVNTFDALEPGALGGGGGGSTDKPELIAVGPLIPTAFLVGDDSSDSSHGGDIHHGPPECIQWLDSKPDASVVYVSFGSYSVLPRQQAEEIARALLDGGRPFLWVIRKTETAEEEEVEISCREELERLGLMVPWCPQVEVLSRPAVGCFVTHCGWNSTLESVVSGVPVVGCPLWTDQGTNARLVESAWGTGVQVQKNEEGMVEAGELGRCLEMVMGGGEAAAEMRKKAAEWRELARDAMRDGGSSDKNIKAFVEGGPGDAQGQLDSLDEVELYAYN